MIRFVNDTKNGQELYISGDIIDDEDASLIKAWAPECADAYNWPAVIKEQLDQLNRNAPLTIYINSSGGSVPAGVAISNMINRWKGPTTCVVDGWACSIATQIFFAGKVRKMPANAYLMIHKPSGAGAGDSNDFRKMAETLDTIQNGLESTYKKAAKGLADEEIHEMVENETWLTGEEACTKFDIELLDSVATAAKWGKAKTFFNHIPQALVLAKEPEKGDEPFNAISEGAKKATEEAISSANQALIHAAMISAERV